MNDNPVYASLFICLCITFAFALLLIIVGVGERASHPFARTVRKLSRSCQRPFDFVSGRPSAAGAALFTLGFAVCGMVCYVADDPVPGVHDEFSYLLAADTFTQGRLANTTHPLWEHFETFHVLQHPMYASKYPPAQGLALALGQILTGWPVVGAWIIMGTAAAAVYWMLRSVLPDRWALLGGLACVFHPLLVRWGTNYWGGGIAMIGGALVLGAAIRLGKRKNTLATAPQGATFGTGLVLLANSRPFEGALFGIFCALLALKKPVLSSRQTTKAAERSSALSPAVFAAIIPLFFAAVWMGFYNHAVTGSALRMPYMEYTSQYDSRPLFLWQKLKPMHTYRTSDLARFYASDQAEHRNQTASGSALFRTLLSKTVAALLFLFWQPALLFGTIVAIIASCGTRFGKRWRPYTLVFVIYIPLILVSSYMFPHYAAPAIGLMVLLGLVGLRYAVGLGRKIKSLRLVPWAILPLLMLTTTAADGVTRYQSAHSNQGRTWKYRRMEVERNLIAAGGKHVLIVRYGPRHSPNFSWVNNGADIDNEPVVWARDLGYLRNKDLIAHFKGYKFHLLYVDEDAATPRLRDYRITSADPR